MNNNAQNLQTLRNIVGNDLYIIISNQLDGKLLAFNSYSCQGFVSKEEQNAAIKRDYYHGMTWDELQNKYGLTMSALYKITQKR